MVADPHAEVRTAVAQYLDFTVEDSRSALPLLDARLRIETHPHVRSALLRARAAVEDETPQRRW